MTNNQLTDERLVKILSETQAAISEHNCRQVRGCVEVDARLFESMLIEIQERRKAEPWCPDIDPITRYPLFMWIEHPELGCVPTYGGPYDSYTLPERDSNGELFRRRYDHDLGGWREDEWIGVNVVEDWLPKDQDELDKYVKDNPPAELQERRKAAAEPIYQLFDMYWYDTDKQTYDTVTGAGYAGRIVYADPQPLTDAERAELQERRKADSENLVKERQRVIDGLCAIGETAWEIEEYMKKWDAENKQRQWPEPKDGEPRLHIKQPSSKG